MTTIPTVLVQRLRRMIHELDNETYDDDTLSSYVESWPIIDGFGKSSDEATWTPTYDLHAAAAEVWEEKAASLSAEYDVTADGQSYHSNQQYTNAMEQARYHRSKMRASVKIVTKRPVESTLDNALGYRNPVDESDGYDDFEWFES